MAENKDPVADADSVALRLGPQYFRRRHEHRCVECDEPFQGIVQAKYCSNACRQRAKYRRSR